MKLSKSKLALAKIINENGGWIDGTMQLAASNKNGSVYLWSNTPRRIRHVWDFGGRFTALRGDWRKLPNWHQTILSREEYYQAYPKADEDGWIEWSGGECPVSEFEAVQVKYKIDDGSGMCGTDAGELHWLHEDVDWDIVAYRLHKPDVKPEFCESVMRSIPEPEAKPTIEQLAQDYRNAKSHAERLQKEAGEAAAKAESFAVEIRNKMLELQELIGIPNPEKEPELVITDWRDLKVGDVIWVEGVNKQEVGEQVVVDIEGIDYKGMWAINTNLGWLDLEVEEWRFIRRP